MAVFITPKATITHAMMMYTITIDVVNIANTLPTDNPATHISNTIVGSSPDIFMKSFASTP